jgi:hypothetical protein
LHTKSNTITPIGNRADRPTATVLLWFEVDDFDAVSARRRNGR